MHWPARHLLLLTICVAGLSAEAGYAQDAPADIKQVTIVRTPAPPVIDGALDETVWQNAARIDDLHQVNPMEFSAPSERTEFYFLVDKDALYVGARVWDSQPDAITANALRQGADLRDEDRVAIILDTFFDHRNGYAFELNPNGVRVDGLWKNTTDFGVEWDGIWEGMAARFEGGWTAEFAIPAKTLAFDASSDTWGINVWRSLQRTKEGMAWVSHNRTTDPSTTGRLIGMTDLDPGLGLDVVPSVSLRRAQTYSPSSSDWQFEPALDVFYKLTSGLTASLTLNTDFSATEVDDRQVNLNRVSLFFPEKRDFFLRDFDIFEFGGIGGGGGPGGGGGGVAAASGQNGRPFFSRRIGLSTTGQPVDIDYGGKVSGRIGEWNLGALAIRQAGYGTVDPTTVLVGRVARNVLDESSLGLIATYGDPTSNLDNNLVGVDFRYRNTRLAGNRILEGEAWYQRSSTEGVHGGQAAWGANLSMPNNDRWRGSVSYKEIQRNFDPALGFINQSGIREAGGSLAYTYRPANARYLRRTMTGVNFQRTSRITGGVDRQFIDLHVLDMEDHWGDVLRPRFVLMTEGFDLPFEISPGVIIPPDVYRYARYGIDFNTGRQRQLSFDLQYRDGDYYDGDRLNIATGVVWHPNRYFALRASYDYNDIHLPYGNFVTRLISAQTEVAFSSRWDWVSIVQFDNVSNKLGVHSRLHFLPREGREMFFVINYNFLQEDGAFTTVSSDITLKASFTFRF